MRRASTDMPCGSACARSTDWARRQQKPSSKLDDSLIAMSPIYRIARGFPLRRLSKLAAADAFRSAGSRPTPGAVAGERDHGGDAVAALPIQRDARAGGGGARRPAAHALGRACRRRLSDHAAVPKGPSGSVPARALSQPATSSRRRELTDVPNGTEVKIAGVVLVRQRPGTASGVIFMTIEDETGHRQCRRLVAGVRALSQGGDRQPPRPDPGAGRAEGRHHPCHRRPPGGFLGLLSRLGNDPAQAGRPACQIYRRHPRDVRIIPKSRDFK